MILFLFLASREVLAHGVEGEIEYLRGAVVVTAWYDTGEPMSYAKVEVYAPDSNIKFQSGRTDRNGRIAFVPDVPGKWRVVISDELGHKLDLSVNITSISPEKPAENTQITGARKSTLLSRKISIIIGLLLIFGLFGWIKEIKQFRQKVYGGGDEGGPGVRPP